MQDHKRSRNRVKIEIEPLEDITYVLSISPMNKRLRIIFNIQQKDTRNIRKISYKNKGRTNNRNTTMHR